MGRHDLCQPVAWQAGVLVLVLGSPDARVSSDVTVGPGGEGPGPSWIETWDVANWSSPKMRGTRAPLESFNWSSISEDHIWW